jgi:hypothetical protein
MIMIVLVRIVRTVLKDWVWGRHTENALVQANTGLMFAKFSRARPHWLWTAGISASAAILLAAPTSWFEWLLVSLISIGLIGTHIVVSRIGTGRSQDTVRASWMPASVVTAALAFALVGFTPSPVLRDGVADRRRIARMGAATLAFAVVCYFVVARTTGAPIASVAAETSLLVLASTLVPVHPLDGSALELRRSTETVITFALAGAAVLLAVDLV